MCGRYAITSAPEAIRRLFGYDEQPNFPPRYNVAPTQPVPIVRMVEGKRQFAVVSRFRSSPELAARSDANFGIVGHYQTYDSSAALNPKFASGLAASVVRTSGSRHKCAGA
jgi:putative SOS response-associated peptidase YedK